MKTQEKEANCAYNSECQNVTGQVFCSLYGAAPSTMLSAIRDIKGDSVAKERKLVDK